MSIPCTFPSHVDAKKAGWFSRRHQTNAAHLTAQERWQRDRDEKRAREQAQHDETAEYRAAAKGVSA